jgi:iron complex outermembrane receptor protein
MRDLIKRSGRFGRRGPVLSVCKNKLLRTAAPLAIMASLGANSALAQQDQSQVETIVVTGTLLHEKYTASPVTVISKDQINNASQTTIADVVRSISADNSGSVPTAFTDGFAAGSSGVALRGLTVNSTLVLIDGLRTADYALSDDGERSFVDLNTIPLDVVDRVDVLKDGASSIYGADAIAGVVNIILKPDFQGEAGEAEGGVSQHGGGAMARATATFGTGDPGTDHYNAYVNVEYEVDQAIPVGDRGFPFNTNNLTSIGGVDLNIGDPTQDTGSIYGSVTPATLTNPNDITTGVPLAGAVSQPLRPCGPRSVQAVDSGNVYCEQNQALYGVDQPYQSRFGVYTRFNVYPNAHTTAYLDGSYFQNDVYVPGGPPQIENSTPNNTNTIVLPAHLTSGALNPNDPFAAAGQDALINYAFGDVPSFSVENNHVVRVVGGLQGEQWGFDYDGALVVAHTWLDTTNAGFLNYNQLISDVETGAYNFINPSANSQATIQALAPVANKISTTDLDEAVMHVTRDLMQFPGGPLAVGGGVEIRYEDVDDPDLNPDQQYEGLGVAHTIGHHTVTSAYAEIGAPLWDGLETDLSGRYDHYSDFGGAFSPKAGVKWQPIDQFMLRGTYSEGFRAPSFAENGSSSSEGFVTYQPPNGNINFINQHGGVGGQNGDGYTQPYGLALLASANPNVKPETSRSFTGGGVFRPFGDDSVTATLDYYNIKKWNVIAQSDPSNALTAYFNGQPIPAGYSIIFDRPDPLYPNGPLRPLVISSPYVNSDQLMTDGVDIDLTVNEPLPYNVNYTGELNLTDIFDYTYTSLGQTVSYVGLQSPYNLSSGAGTPRWRGNWSNTFSYQDLSVSAVFYYIDGMWQNAVDLFGPGTGEYYCIYPNAPHNCRMESFWDMDLTARYKLNDHMELFGSIKNFFDRGPPVDPSNYATVNYNPTYTQEGIVGRFFGLGIRVSY